jgi:hypothetical protein
MAQPPTEYHNTRHGMLPRIMAYATLYFIYIIASIHFAAYLFTNLQKTTTTTFIMNMACPQFLQLAAWVVLLLLLAKLMPTLQDA